MTKLTFVEQSRLAGLLAGRLRRRALARVLRSPLLRWRYGAPIADEVLVVPRDLRTSDPSFAFEVENGDFGLAGRVAHLPTGSPFDLHPPSVDWQRELHGFTWLRHLRSAASPQSKAMALRFVADWIARCGGAGGVAWEPPVVARRLISWIVNASILIEDVDQLVYDRTADSLAAQLIHLSATWGDAPDGYPRLLALTALLYGDLCIAGHEHRLAETERLFAEELSRQVFADGGHISRNPGVLIELLLDFLPLRQCFASRGRDIPPALDGAIGRMLQMLRYMRIGDGSLARFNGMGATPSDHLATVIAYDTVPPVELSHATDSHYRRLSRGATTVLMDVGAPPPLALAGEAHAGCLSIELSSGGSPVFVNGGAPGPADQQWRPSSRATAAHNTLCLANKSSSRLVRHPLLESLVGAPPLRFPDRVRSRYGAANEGDFIEAYHDGYVALFKLRHSRKLALAASGDKLAGRDMLGAPKGVVRLARDLPFAIAFHLHPSVECRQDRKADAVELTLNNAERWRFTVSGAAISLEDSVHYADWAGPRESQQIVLRGATFGETEVRWRLTRI